MSEVINRTGAHAFLPGRHKPYFGILAVAHDQRLIGLGMQGEALTRLSCEEAELITLQLISRRRALNSAKTANAESPETARTPRETCPFCDQAGRLVSEEGLTFVRCTGCGARSAPGQRLEIEALVRDHDLSFAEAAVMSQDLLIRSALRNWDLRLG